MRKDYWQLNNICRLLKLLLMLTLLISVVTGKKPYLDGIKSADFKKAFREDNGDPATNYEPGFKQIVSLQSSCSEKYVQVKWKLKKLTKGVNAKRKFKTVRKGVNARGQYKSKFGFEKLAIESTSTIGVVRIQGVVSKQYLCFNLRGFPFAKHHGEGEQCLFKETNVNNGSNQFSYQSVMNKFFKLGFRKNGKPLRQKRKPPRQRGKMKRRQKDCFRFTKFIRRVINKSETNITGNLENLWDREGLHPGRRSTQRNPEHRKRKQRSLPFKNIVNR